MRALDIIIKKRDGGSCTRAEIDFLLMSYLKGNVPDYQMVAFLMATYFQGMSDAEIAMFTESMMHTGHRYDLSGLGLPLVDKHSTGGVGDTVSLLLAPMVAAAGVSVPMMSGRSLGHTGGTLDKLESIEGYEVQLSEKKFRHILRTCGYAMTGQTTHIVPADRKLYGLRDVTGTIESIPLIVSSILSKKFAEGCEALVLDVKYGSGAFMKSLPDARKLAETLIHTAKHLGKPTVGVLTPMESPLGRMVGNFLEVEETVSCLSPEHPTHRLSQDLIDLTVELGAWMLLLGNAVSQIEEGRDRCKELLMNGSAWNYFCQNVEAQGGKMDTLLKDIGVRRASKQRDIVAESSGFLASIDAYAVGIIATQLGAGRSKKDDIIIPEVGIELHAKPGDKVHTGDVLLTIWYEGHSYEESFEKMLKNAITITEKAPHTSESIFEVIQ